MPMDNARKLKLGFTAVVMLSANQAFGQMIDCEHGPMAIEFNPLDRKPHEDAYALAGCSDWDPRVLRAELFNETDPPSEPDPTEEDGQERKD